jgi:hypothetical protein
MSDLGRLVMIVGALLLIAGAWMAWGPRLPWLGRLPGDVSVGGDHWRVYAPLGTCLLISLVLTVLFRLFARR